VKSTPFECAFTRYFTSLYDVEFCKKPRGVIVLVVGVFDLGFISLVSASVHTHFSKRMLFLGLE
jgi:hypothetical protein